MQLTKIQQVLKALAENKRIIDSNGNSYKVHNEELIYFNNGWREYTVLGHIAYPCHIKELNQPV